ncbi:peroxide stress protein YaaA [Canibacter sp. lx-72]|nr:peroxide stress protein YaaA [Canibacter zhuwentaonis]
MSLSTAPDERAYKSLKLRPSPKADVALAANRALVASGGIVGVAALATNAGVGGLAANRQSTSSRESALNDDPAINTLQLPAILRYTGVLYDALNATELNGQALMWLAQHVCVQSALYGIVGAADPIANYRLSAASSLPELKISLKKFWQGVFQDIDLCSAGFVLDLRSNDYVSLAPLEYGDTAVKLRVAQRAADGSLKALNHFNKQAKGELVRRLACSGADITDAAGFTTWARAHDLEVVTIDDELTLITKFDPKVNQ